MIVCFAIIGQQNQPLYMRTFCSITDEQMLNFHFITHCTLDAVEEKGEVPDTYLGLLFPTSQFKVYGYMTNTHIKLLLVLTEVITKDEPLSQLFRKLHGAYVDAVSNPFHVMGLPLISERFDVAVDAAVGGSAFTPNAPP